MNPLLKHLSIFLFTQLVITQTSLHAAEQRDTMPDTWSATDAQGRTLPMSAEVGVPKANRTVGIFYFNWHAAFGNKEVHDIAKILAANPADDWSHSSLDKDLRVIPQIPVYQAETLIGGNVP